MSLYSKVLVALLATVMSWSTQAFTQETHKRIVQDAVHYMSFNPETTHYAKLKAVAEAAGYTIEAFADALGQGAYDVDEFKDTYICGVITGDCQYAPVWSLSANIVKYTSFWHYQNHSQGFDSHGNDFGGYNSHQLTMSGEMDQLASAWLYNDHLDDGRGGYTGICYTFWGKRRCLETSRFNVYGVTEANYRQESYSSPAMYKDFQTMPFQPIDNLAQYWYSQFLEMPTAQALGFTLHATDLLQPHHTWTTIDFNHGSWEAWVEDYYGSANLNDFELVAYAMKNFTPLDVSTTDIRSLLTEGGAISYASGGIVLASIDHYDRVDAGQIMIPNAIAMVVHLLNHAAMRF